MKKRILISILAVIALLSAFSALASADSYCNLGTVYTGAVVNYRIADLSDGCTAGCDNLPAGLQLSAIGGGIYLTGAAQTAGDRSFVIYTDDPITGSVTCNLYVTAAAPQITVSADVDCMAGDYALLSAAVFSGDGGAVSYQWYAGCTPEGTGGYPIGGANWAEYSPDTSNEGTEYYCCVVTNGQGVSASSKAIRVTVKALQAESIMVHTLPRRVEYRSGQLLDVEGLTIEVRYANGSTAIVDEGLSVSAGSYDEAGRTLFLNVEYRGRQCSFPVYVTDGDPTVIGIGMVRLPDKQEYDSGEPFDGAGLVFRVYYDDGSYSDESGGYTVDPVILQGDGTQTVTLFCNGFSCTFPVEVRQRRIIPDDTLEVVSTPAKLSYRTGDSLDVSGLVLRETVNGIVTAVHTGYSVYPTVLTAAGVQTVTVTYNGRCAYFTVEVKEAETVKSVVNEKIPGVKDKLDSAMEKINIQPTGTANKGLIVAVLTIALLALGALGAYMLILENGGIEEIKYRLECKVYEIRKKIRKR